MPCGNEKRRVVAREIRRLTRSGFARKTIAGAFWPWAGHVCSVGSSRKTSARVQ